MNQNIRICDLTVGEFQSLVSQTLAAALAERQTTQRTDRRTLGGNRALADFLGCSESTVRRYKAAGVFDRACWQRGRTIIYDADAALAAFGAVVSRLKTNI